MLRRTFVRSGTLTGGPVALSGVPWQAAWSSGAPGPGPYGEPRDPDPNGVALPDGFRSRVVARSGRRVGGPAGIIWHPAPGAAGCFPDGEGWIHVSTSEMPFSGGVSALVFGPDGTVRHAYRILSGTDLNHAGGATPWHTWLSGEAVPDGRIFECDPYGSGAAMPRLAMGRFRHASLACDPDRHVIYLTEDEPDGCFYRFVPEDWGDLTTGRLEVLLAGPVPGPARWARVPSPAAPLEPTRRQVPGAARFAGATGCHYGAGVCSFTTRGDGRVWAYDAAHERLGLLHDPDRPPRAAADPVAAPHRGDRYLALDGGVPEIGILTPDGAAATFLRVVHAAAEELTGLAFSPDGRRLYFSCRERGAAAAAGITYEVTGPFRD